MSDTEQHPIDNDATLIGVSFSDVFRAREFMTAAARLASNNKLSFSDAVLVVKSAAGATVVQETIDPPPGRSALTGAMWAGLFGLLLGGPVGWLAGTAIGAGAGAVTAKVVDLGVPDAWVNWFRETVQPDTATVVLLVDSFDQDALVAEAARFAGAHIVYANLDPSILKRVTDAFESGSAT